MVELSVQCTFMSVPHGVRIAVLRPWKLSLVSFRCDILRNESMDQMVSEIMCTPSHNDTEKLVSIALLIPTDFT